MPRSPKVPGRDRARGVAVLEFTLSLVFLIPLLMATLDFGYYFYVGATAEEAARQGVQQAVRMAGGPCAAAPACNVPVNTLVTKMASGSGTACQGATGAPNPPPAASCYMNNAPLFLGADSTKLNITCVCAANALNPPSPTYTITVRIDFKPAVGVFRYLIPNDGSGGTMIRYTAKASAN